MEVDISKNLASQITDWHASAFLVFIVAGQYILYKQICRLASNPPLNKLQKQLLVNTVKELSDICAPDPIVTVFVHKFYGSICGRMQTFALPARPSVIYKNPVPNWLQVIIDKTMDHPIAYRRDGYFPSLAIANFKIAIASVFITTLNKGGV